MLTFNLKKVWFDKIKSGEKTHEYREVKPYWTTRLNNFVCKNFPASLIVEFKKGYSKEKGLYARIINISKINGKHTDLALDKDVYDIEFELIESEG